MNLETDRAHAEANQLDEFFDSEIKFEHAIDDCHGDFVWMARCIAEVYRDDWRQQLLHAESNLLSFDGHREWDVLTFSCINIPSLEVTHGALGLLNRWQAHKETLTSTTKSERTVAAIEEEIEHFSTRLRTMSSKQQKQSLTSDERRLLKDDHMVRAFWDRNHVMAADRCAEAQLTARTVALQLAKGCGMVVPDVAHMVKTWFDNATGSEPELSRIMGVVFLAKDAPGKTLRYSPEERELMVAYQREERQMLDDNEKPIVLAKCGLNWSSAPHRWETNENRMVALCLGYKAFGWKCADASQNRDYKHEIRRAYGRCVQHSCGNEAATLIGLHCDFLASSLELIEKIEGDDQDCSEIPFELEEFGEKLKKCYMDAGLFGPDGKHTYTQLMLRTAKDVQAFHYEDPNGKMQIKTLGWTLNAARTVQEFARAALRKYQAIVKVLLGLVQSYYNSDLPDVWMRCFCLRKWAASYAMPPSEGGRVRSVLLDCFKKLAAHYRVLVIDTEFEALMRCGLDYFMAKLQGLIQRKDSKEGKAAFRDHNKNPRRHAIKSLTSSHGRTTDSMRVCAK